MPTFKLMISGLCIFAFDRPLPKGQPNGQKPTSATLLLQRLTQSRQLTHMLSSSKHDVLDQHFPLLAFDADDLDPKASDRGPDFLGVPVNGKMTKGVCLLFGDDLTISIDGRPMQQNALALSVDRPSDPFAPQVTDANLSTLWWMATLEDAFPGNGTINPIFIKSKPGPNQPILSRLQLGEGTLMTAALTDDPCTFLPPGSQSFNQRIATSFVLEIPFQKTVEIGLERPKGTGVDPRKIVFAPPAGKDLVIDIKNMEVNQLIGFDMAYGIPQATADFEVYADLLQNPIIDPTTNKVLGTALVRNTIGGSAGVGLSHCPPSGG